MNRMIRTWVEISLSTLEHNYREICSHLPEGCQLLGICKANSYGHGAVRVAQLLQQLGCRWIAVNNYDEAEELRAAGVSTEILLLSPQPANIAVDLAELDVTQSISSLDYAPAPEPSPCGHRSAPEGPSQAGDGHGPHGV